MLFLLKNTLSYSTLALLAVLLLVPAPLVASFSVSPPVIDRSGVPRDSIQETITLTNRENYRVRVFTFVNNVSVEEEGGREEFERLRGLETAESLANWVSVTRQRIELEPGESKEVTLSVDVHMDAEPGTYHAFISFAEGARRSEAEERITRDRAVLLSITVDDDSEDILQLTSFAPESRIVSSAPVEFSAELDNRGDTTLTPEGELIVYDRRGREIEAAVFNEEARSLEPGESDAFTVVWNGELDWGRHRARLDLSYGRGRGLDDSVFFTVLPVIPLTMIFVVLLVLLLSGVHFLHKRQERALAGQSRSHRHFEEEADEHTIDLR